jgi:hypothetical protein
MIVVAMLLGGVIGGLVGGAVVVIVAAWGLEQLAKALRK